MKKTGGADGSVEAVRVFEEVSEQSDLSGKSELVRALAGRSVRRQEDAPSKPEELFELEEMSELSELSELERLIGEVDLSGDGPDLPMPDLDYDLSRVQTLDLRPLSHRAWYRAEIVGAQPGFSKAGNPQIEFIFRVIQAYKPMEDAKGQASLAEVDEVDEHGASVVGVTVYDYAPTPKAPLTAKKIQSLWKLKAIGAAAGLAELGANHQVERLKRGTKPTDFIGRVVFFRNTIDRSYDTDGRNKPDAYSAAL